GGRAGPEGPAPVRLGRAGDPRGANGRRCGSDDDRPGAADAVARFHVKRGGHYAVAAPLPVGPSAPAAVVVEDVPVIALVGVEIARRRSVLVAPARDVPDVGERRGDVVVDAGTVPDIELVSVPVRVGTARVPGLGRAGDRDAASGRGPERGDPVDRRLSYLLERCARRDAAVAASATRGPGDTCGAQLAGCLGVREERGRTRRRCYAQDERGGQGREE